MPISAFPKPFRDPTKNKFTKIHVQSCLSPALYSLLSTWEEVEVLLLVWSNWSRLGVSTLRYSLSSLVRVWKSIIPPTIITRMYTVLMPISEFMKPINEGPAIFLSSVLPSLYPSINFEICVAWSFPRMLSEPITYQTQKTQVKLPHYATCTHVYISFFMFMFSFE